MTRFEYFCERWEELSDSEKISLFNEYCSEVTCDQELFSFDEEFFELFFSNNPMEAARATLFGSVCWSDEYISFDGYGNLESLSESQAVSRADDYQREIYDLDRFGSYIDMNEYDNPEEDDD